MRLYSQQGWIGVVTDLDTGKTVPSWIWVDIEQGLIEAYQTSRDGNVRRNINGDYLTFNARGRFKFTPTASPKNHDGTGAGTVRQLGESVRGGSPAGGRHYSSPPTSRMCNEGPSPLPSTPSKSNSTTQTRSTAQSTKITLPKIVMGAEYCSLCNSPLTLPGDDLCPPCRAKERGQKNKLLVERIVNPLLDRKCCQCSRLASWSVSDEVAVTPQMTAGSLMPVGRNQQGKLVFRKGKVLYDRGYTVGRRYFCSWHYRPPRLLDSKGELVSTWDEAGGVRPQWHS